MKEQEIKKYTLQDLKVGSVVKSVVTKGAWRTKGTEYVITSRTERKILGESCFYYYYKNDKGTSQEIMSLKGWEVIKI